MSTPKREVGAAGAEPGSSQRRRVPRAASLLAAAFLVLGTVGCWHSPSVDRVAWAVEDQIPGAAFDRETHVRLGRLSTGFVRWVANLALDDDDPDEHQAKTLVNAVRRVEVGVYENHGKATAEDLEAVAMPRSLTRMLAEEGWQVMVDSHDDGERAWVMAHQDERAIDGIYVVALDSDELSVVRLEGRFDEAFARALSQQPHDAAKKVLEDSGKEGADTAGPQAGAPATGGS